MTVTTDKRRTQAKGEGLTKFSTTFSVTDVDHVKVVKRSAAGVESVLVKDVDYTISLIREKAVMVLDTPLADSEIITAVRDIPTVQPLLLMYDISFPAIDYETQWDNILRISLQFLEEIDRLPLVPVSQTVYNLPSPAASQFIRWNSGGTALETVEGPITEISEDTSPILGGNLDLGGYAFTSTGGNDVTVDPDGAGTIELEGDTNLTGNITVSGTISADTLSPSGLILGGNLNVGSYSLISSSNGDIDITPDGSGQVVLDGFSWPTSDGTANQILSTDGSGNLSFIDEEVTTYSDALSYLPTYQADHFEFFDDFMSGISGASTSTANTFPVRWYNRLGSSVSISQNSLENTSIGTVRFSVSSGSSSTRYASLSAFNLCNIGGGEITVEWRVKVDRLPDDSDDPYQMIVGIGFSATSTKPSYSLGFHLDNRNTNENNWYLFTNDGASETSTDSTEAATVDTWTKLKLVINAAGTSVEYFIDDVSVGTVAMDVFSDARDVGPTVWIDRHSSGGTNTIAVDLDYCYFKKTFTEPRSIPFVPSFLLLESDDYLLLEDETSKLELE